MPDQAGTWLGSRRARRRVPQVDGYWPGPGSDRRQRAGAGRVPHYANTFVQSANVAVWYAVRTFRTASRPGRESNPACEAARRV